MTGKMVEIFIKMGIVIVIAFQDNIVPLKIRIVVALLHYELVTQDLAE